MFGLIIYTNKMAQQRHSKYEEERGKKRIQRTHILHKQDPNHRLSFCLASQIVLYDVCAVHQQYA